MSDLASLVAAMDFAADKHRNQRRKNAEASPYINHPIQLAHVLTGEGKVTDIKTLMAAILHDTIEDTETTYDELVRHFGHAVADAVMEVTDDKSLPKTERKARQIEHAPHLSPRAKLVKLADKICNVRDMAHSPPASWPLTRRHEYFEWAKLVVDGLRGVHPQLEKAFDLAYEKRPEA